MRWRSADPQPGFASRTIMGLILTLGTAWLAWPVWSSLSAPDRDAVSSLTPALLTALGGLLLLLAWGLWRDAGRQMAVFAPVLGYASVAALFRLLLLPRASGLEPVFAVPLLAGATLGAPAGFLAGVLACLGSSAALGLITDPIIGQCVVWGMWGAAGGLVRPLSARWAWPLATLLCLPVGVASGFLLNLIGWAGERTADRGAFLPGVGPAESFQRLWDYTVATSAAFDLTRALSSAALIALIGLPVIAGFRATLPPPTTPQVDGVPPPPALSPRAVERRRRSDHLAELWPATQGESS